MTSVSNIVSVVIGTTPTFPSREGFGLLNIVGSSASLPIGDRLRFYENLLAVGLDFGASSEEYKAALIYFSQSPSPAKLAISRRFAAAVAGELLGGSGVSPLFSAYTAITAGSFAITVDGVVKQVTGLDFSGAASMNAIAAIIQTRLAVVAAGGTAVWLGNRFKLTSGTTGSASNISFAGAPAAGTDVSALLGLDLNSGGKTTAGSAAESITQALNNLQIVSSNWYGLALTSEATQQNVLDASAWAEANLKIHGPTTQASNNKDPASLTSLGYLLRAAGYRRTFLTYDDNDPYAGVSAMARLFTVDFNQPNSTITLKFKVLPGVSFTVLTESERLALVANNVNYYSQFGAVPMLAEGKMANGTFIDEVFNLDWLRQEIEDSVFAYLYTRATKVPQTDKGVASIVQQVEKAFAKAVNNGLLAPGQWDGADLGNIKSGDFLAKGYYVYAGRVADQTIPDRDARRSPPISAIALGAGAIHSVAIGVTFQR